MFKVMVDNVLRDAYDFGARMPIRYHEFETVWAVLTIQIGYWEDCIVEYEETGSAGTDIENAADLERVREELANLIVFVDRIKRLHDETPASVNSIWKEV